MTDHEINPYRHQSDPSPEDIQNLLTNKRGENIDATVELFGDPEMGLVWQQWTTQNLPVDVYREFGMLGVEGSEEWMNVVEHNVFVAASALTVGEQLTEDGVAVDLNKLVRAAIIHDASKRLDVESKISRKGEVVDKTFESVVARHGYTKEEIAMAKNTGRLDDRYLQDPVERMRAVANHSIEENITGYVDARTRQVHIHPLTDARDKSIQAKPKDQDFFANNWYPYYNAVETYFGAIAPHFKPAEITDDIVYATVKRYAVAAAD